ncbi:hypothetical protein [Micromonospora zhanjiangensis]|uniref:FXSXX-COOH protein n=1 Tax=Micromonospora zhanjiangensis TaxID=1522057 RepID=A0ABV8KMG0_9ACTN
MQRFDFRSDRGAARPAITGVGSLTHRAPAMDLSTPLSIDRF